jgi:quinoprotein glucose dehydrogenase
LLHRHIGEWPGTTISNRGGAPGSDGGAEWGGAAVDLRSGILYVNSNEVPYSITMIDVPKENSGDLSRKGMGQAVYNKNCIACHGPDLKGNGASYPSLVNLNKKYKEEQVRQIINTGRNMMPAFKEIPENEKEFLLAFLLNLEEKEHPSQPGKLPVAHKRGGANTYDLKDLSEEVPFTLTGYNKFLDKNGYPGIKPPWGTLNAINLASGKLLWKVPLGELEELTKKGIPPTGTENYGGPLVTKGGLVFIAATMDAKIRAFDKDTGKVLWEAPLPVPGYATPATYTLEGRQYLVIACGGGKLGSKSGDEYIAFALPVTVKPQ